MNTMDTESLIEIVRERRGKTPAEATAADEDDYEEDSFVAVDDEYKKQADERAAARPRVVTVTAEMFATLQKLIGSIRRRERRYFPTHTIALSWKSVMEFVERRHYKSDLDGAVLELAELTLVRRDPSQPLSIEANCMLVSHRSCKSLGHARKRTRRAADACAWERDARAQAASEVARARERGVIDKTTTRQCAACHAECAPHMLGGRCYASNKRTHAHYAGDWVCTGCYDVDTFTCSKHTPSPAPAQPSAPAPPPEPSHGAHGDDSGAAHCPPHGEEGRSADAH